MRHKHTCMQPPLQQPPLPPLLFLLLLLPPPQRSLPLLEPAPQLPETISTTNATATATAVATIAITTAITTGVAGPVFCLLVIPLWRVLAGATLVISAMFWRRCRQLYLGQMQPVHVIIRCSTLSAIYTLQSHQNMM